MKLYTSILLTDDTTIVLTPRAFGAWMRVLCTMHQKGSPEMRKSPRLWGQIFGCGPNEEEASEIISELFEAGTGKITLFEDGTVEMYSKRMDETLKEQRKQYRQGRKRKKIYLDKKQERGTQTERVPDAFGSTSTSTSPSTSQSIEKNKKKESESARFQKPDFGDVYNYFCDRKILAEDAVREARKFFDHYESNGWRVGKNTMKDWKAAVRGWISRMKDYSKEKPSGTTTARQHGALSAREALVAGGYEVGSGDIETLVSYEPASE